MTVKSRDFSCKCGILESIRKIKCNCNSGDFKTTMRLGQAPGWMAVWFCMFFFFSSFICTIK